MNQPTKDQITRGQILELIDTLADKGLTFGCEFISKISPHTGKGKVIGWINESFFEAIMDDGWCWEFRSRHVENLGHPILIGDVLEKICTSLQPITIESDKELILSYQNKLLKFWQPLGFTKSLQEIYAEIEWENTIDPCCGDSKGHGHIHIKQASHREFFQFILNLNL